MAEIILTGDALEQLRHLPPESVHTCVTSPPYYNLRDYGAAGQIGNEASVEEYLQSLVSVFREVRRVLRADGTLWVNMGDSYATRSGSQPPTNTRNSCGHTAKHTPRGYKYLLATLREQSLPELAAEIAADWDLPTEAVQSGLETLRSHLELMQSDAALLYEMT